MKKFIIPFVLLAAFTLAIVVSCNKKKNEGTAPTQSLNQVFKDLRPAPQYFSIEVGRDTVVYAYRGTMLHFYPNSFETDAGNIMTLGIVSIQLVEMYKPGDMVQSRATTTTTDGKLLESGGQVSIVATKDGKPVKANKYGIGFKQDNYSEKPMSIFYGNSDNTDSVVKWINNTSTNLGDTQGVWAPQTTYVDPNGFGFAGGWYYLLDSCTNFDFINCDLLYDKNTENTTVKVVLPDNSFKPTNTQIFLALPEINAITTSDNRQEYDAASNTFALGNHGNEVPVNMAYKIIVIANKDGDYYFCQLSGTTSKNMTVTANMAPETRGDIVARLQGL